MLNALRAKRDAGIGFIEESARNKASNTIRNKGTKTNPITLSELRRLRANNLTLNNSITNLIAQIDNVLNIIRETRIENDRLRKQARSNSAVAVDKGTGRKKLTAKIRDPPVFTGNLDNKKPVNYEDWEIAICKRFDFNYNHFTNNIAKAVFTCNSTGGDVAAHLRPRRMRGANDPYLTATDVFKYLSGIYGEVDRQGKARREYRVLYQGTNNKFAAFKSNILRLAGIINYKNNHIRDNIYNQIAGRLKDVLRINPYLRHTASLKKLLNWLQQLDNDQIADIEKKKTLAIRKEEKKPVAGTIIEKKITIYSTGSFDRDNIKAKRLKNKRRLGLYYYCK